MLSIVIPSKGDKERREIFLKNTIEDVLRNATGEIEVFPFLDGYEPPPEEIVNDPRVHYQRFPPTNHSKKRQAINMMVNDLSHGEHVMSLDAHCMVAPGFDEVLVRDLEENWVAIPRRNRLDAEHWCLQTQVDARPPIDYEYIMWPLKFDPPSLHGFKWDERTLSRQHIMIDDTIQFQGSMWVMHKTWFKRCGFMDLRYQGWGQEAECIGFTTRFYGGRVVTNKNTWYAHLHKGPTYGRMYHLDRNETRASSAYAYNLWVNERRDFFIRVINEFGPLPGWPTNWEDKLYAKASD
jgi:hypothetical protein